LLSLPTANQLLNHLSQSSDDRETTVAKIILQVLVETFATDFDRVRGQLDGAILFSSAPTQSAGPCYLRQQVLDMPDLNKTSNDGDHWNSWSDWEGTFLYRIDKSRGTRVFNLSNGDFPACSEADKQHIKAQLAKPNPFLEFHKHHPLVSSVLANLDTDPLGIYFLVLMAIDALEWSDKSVEIENAESRFRQAMIELMLN